MEKLFVALYRVSTARQGESGLGLDSQREKVERHVRACGGRIVHEIRDVESGRKNTKSVLAALGACRRLHASLIVARLDRLSRRASVLIAIRESGVPVVVADQPHLDATFWNMQAVWAEHEARLVSERTRAALKQARKRGVKLGGPQPLTDKGRALGRCKRSEVADERASAAFPAIRLAQRQGAITLTAIADALNASGVATPSKHGSWNPCMVARVQQRLGLST